AEHAKKRGCPTQTARPGAGATESTPTRRAHTPAPASTPKRSAMLFGRERTQEIHHVPRLRRRERLAVRGHHGPADDDVAVPVTVGALALQLGVGQIRRRDELGRDGTGDTPLALGPVAGPA